MKLLYKFASRSRPEKFFKCLDNIQSLSRHDDYLILCSLDKDDVSMNTPEVILKLTTYKKVLPIWGESKTKTEAINRDINLIDDWDILLNHSDDMVFTKIGFDLDIIEAFKDFDGLVHFPDQVAKEKLITYAMMSKEYFNQFGYIYHPSFISVYSDNYQQYIAQKTNKYKFVDKQILRHEHPIWGFGIADELNKKTEDKHTYELDRLTFERLKKEFDEKN